jgi:hypothetical protein
VSGVNAVAYTDASPTVAELWPKLADAIQRVNAGRFMPATAIYMHPRRWGWITSALDTAGRPLFNFNTTPSATTRSGSAPPSSTGRSSGRSWASRSSPTRTSRPPTPVAPRVPAPRTRSSIARTTDFLLWEDSLLKFTFEQAPSTAPGQVRLAIGRFGLFHAGRYPLGISVVSGTGLTPPTF